MYDTKLDLIMISYQVKKLLIYMYLTVLYVRLHCCAKITVKDFISNIAIDFEIIKGEKDKFINH